MSGRWAAENSVRIIERIVIEGDLVAVTPIHLGDGVGEANTLLLLCDSWDDTRPLLPGASIAGALRARLHERQYGYNKLGDKESDSHVSALLFGGIRGDDNGDHSRLIVDDAVGIAGTVIDNERPDAKHITRAGVRIDGGSGTAADTALYSVQLWEVGTCFPLRFELTIREGDDRDTLLSALATALDGLANGEIALGARKRRGFGQVSVPNSWRIKHYHLTHKTGLIEWLQSGGDPLTEAAQPNLFTALGVTPTVQDNRRAATLKAYFTLESSLLIREARLDPKDNTRPNFVHLHRRDSHKTPLLSGTSVGGALRARATKIARTLYDNDERARALIDSMFGTHIDNDSEKAKKKLEASRLTVKETIIDDGVRNLVQSRVSIDRFTGGALDTALFSEQPVFGSAERGVCIELHLRDPKDYEIGLLLLLLKDLWTGDLTLGGEKSVGRGRLRGVEAMLNAPGVTVTITANGDTLTLAGSDAPTLQAYVNALDKPPGHSS